MKPSPAWVCLLLLSVAAARAQQDGDALSTPAVTENAPFDAATSSPPATVDAPSALPGAADTFAASGSASASPSPDSAAASPSSDTVGASPLPDSAAASPSSDTVGASPLPDSALASTSPDIAGTDSSSGPSPPLPEPSSSRGSSGSCPAYIDTKKYRTTNFTDHLNTTVSISPKRPKANVPVGDWIEGRATFYGTDEKVEAAHVACGEPAGQYGIIAQGSCGYTNSDGSLPFPREMYAANADTNVDYPGSCGRCYEVRCRTGSPSNNGRPLLMSDLIYARPYQVKDNFGRDWPGNPKETEDLFYTQCWNDTKSVVVRVSDSCPCQYPIKGPNGTVQEIRTQNWCCGGNNHFDLSFWAFEQLAHPSYGVMPIEYRPVNCESVEPLRPVPGFVNKTIYSDSIQPGWNWMPYPYGSKNAVLLAKGQGVAGSNATCLSLTPKTGGLQFKCRQCSRPGYQPFAKAKSFEFDIRSNTQSSDKFASATPRGQLPPVKIFMMNADNETYCGAEVILSDSATAVGNSMLVPVAGLSAPIDGEDGWYHVSIPLSTWACDRGSVGNLTAVDRIDFQNINERDADICLDNIALV